MDEKHILYIAFVFINQFIWPYSDCTFQMHGIIEDSKVERNSSSRENF